MTDEGDPHFFLSFTPHEMLMGVLYNAHHSGLSLWDLIQVAEHAQDLDAIDEAVALLGMGAIDTDPLGSILRGQADGR